MKLDNLFICLTNTIFLVISLLLCRFPSFEHFSSPSSVPIAIRSYWGLLHRLILLSIAIRQLSDAPSVIMITIGLYKRNEPRSMAEYKKQRNNTKMTDPLLCSIAAHEIVKHISFFYDLQNRIGRTCYSVILLVLPAPALRFTQW